MIMNEYLYTNSAKSRNEFENYCKLERMDPLMLLSGLKKKGEEPRIRSHRIALLGLLIKIEIIRNA